MRSGSLSNRSALRMNSGSSATVIIRRNVIHWDGYGKLLLAGSERAGKCPPISVVPPFVLNHLAIRRQAAGRSQLHFAAQLGDVAHRGHQGLGQSVAAFC